MKSPVSTALLMATLMLVGCSDLSVHIVRPASEPDDASAAPKTEASLESVYQALATAGAGPIYELEPEQSQVMLFVYRGGTAADQGHDHVISVPQFEGFALLPAKLADARFDLRFRLDSMTVDDPALRAAVGGAFGDPISSSGIEGTREHMLGDQSLQAAAFPEVRLHALGLEGDLPKLILRLAVTLHGQTVNVELPMTVTTEAGTLQAQGSFVFRQTDFGIRPYSVMHGLLKVQDPVMVEFRLRGKLHHFSS